MACSHAYQDGLQAWIQSGISPYSAASNTSYSDGSSGPSSQIAEPSFRNHFAEPEKNDEKKWCTKNSILHDLSTISAFTQEGDDVPLNKAHLKKQPAPEEKMMDAPKPKWDSYEYVAEDLQRKKNVEARTKELWSKQPIKPSAKVVNKGRGALLGRNVASFNAKIGSHVYQNQFIEQEFSSSDKEYFEDKTDEEEEQTKSSSSSKKEVKREVYVPPHRREEEEQTKSSSSSSRTNSSKNEVKREYLSSSVYESAEESLLSSPQPKTTRSPNPDRTRPSQNVRSDSAKPFRSLLSLTNSKAAFERAAIRNPVVLKMFREKENEPETNSTNAADDNLSLKESGPGVQNQADKNGTKKPTLENENWDVNLLREKLSALQRQQDIDSKQASKHDSPDSMIRTPEEDSSSSVSDPVLDFNEENEAAGYSSGFEDNGGEVIQIIPPVPLKLKLMTVEDDSSDDDGYDISVKKPCPFTTYGPSCRGARDCNWMSASNFSSSENKLSLNEQNFPSLRK